ncbi:acyltransferase [Novosphingobium sp.]|uniref:acyltransferase n=1 Tax=Novosphingobium sp. TaxID=1874826 RepID=UPI00286DE5B1|nr:acyltransferase [Novosphingobium sp.]
MILRKGFALLRRMRLALRSAAMRAYFRTAYPGISCAASARFGPRARLRAFAGGSIEIGAGCFIHDDVLMIADGGALRLEAGTHVGRGSVIACKEGITIGAGSQVAEQVTIRDHDHNWQGDAPLAEQGFATAPIAIGHDVWLAAKVTVTKGVTIAARSVVGANSVVTRSLETRGAYAGAPARLLGAPTDQGNP